jgi:hypothetical protein
MIIYTCRIKSKIFSLCNLSLFDYLPVNQHCIGGILPVNLVICEHNKTVQSVYGLWAEQPWNQGSIPCRSKRLALWPNQPPIQ